MLLLSFAFVRFLCLWRGKLAPKPAGPGREFAPAETVTGCSDYSTPRTENDAQQKNNREMSSLPPPRAFFGPRNRRDVELCVYIEFIMSRLLRHLRG